MTYQSLARWGLVAAMMSACAPPPDDDLPEPDIRRVGNDLVGSRDEVDLAEDVPGDVMLTGGNVRYTGTAGGTYLGAGGVQTFGGRTEGSLRIAGGKVMVSGAVARNATLAGGEVVLDTSARITRNAYLAGGTVRVAGQVGQELSVVARDVILDGVVGGDVTVAAQRLRLGPTARISGRLAIVSRRDA